ncbi:MAG: HEAT repeat domain-containing protein, partial [Abitibacteriaceae bacterium]|nr:HEAT repeat domain-containing protein [Abditibacteriaceae bacterium]
MSGSSSSRAVAAPKDSPKKSKPEKSKVAAVKSPPVKSVPSKAAAAQPKAKKTEAKVDSKTVSAKAKPVASHKEVAATPPPAANAAPKNAAPKKTTSKKATEKVVSVKVLEDQNPTSQTVPEKIDTVLDKPAVENSSPEKGPTTITAKEMRVQELLSELEGKSETTQRPIIDEIVKLGQPAIKPLARALNSGATFQVRMASATALGEIGNERCVQPLVQALADSSLNVQRAAVNALSLLGEPA